MTDRTLYKAKLYKAANIMPMMDRKYMTDILNLAAAEFLAMQADGDMEHLDKICDWFIRWFGDGEEE